MNEAKHREIAALLLARDEGAMESPGMVDWAHRLLEAAIGQPHSGDCTNVSHSCVVCTYDRAMADAAIIMRAYDEQAATDGKQASE